MDMDLNLGVIMVKISTIDFLMVADDVHRYGCRLFPVIRKDFVRGQIYFLEPRFIFLSQDLQKNQKLKNEEKIEDEIIFLQVLGEIEGMEWKTMTGVLNEKWRKNEGKVKEK